ncbi:saccharopine dehydrogenase NADP-binding domain-containing protein [Streptomyces sp. NPDC050560]|uniref:saccharopine dehydrogenase NADP-binding domain-containing protein n=1 Tax=Streptomyces sp. NPDC050560 TaxID=3365630 RepID=UPI00378DE856
MIGLVGGHGAVGRHTIRFLALHGAGPLRIGGRNLDRVRDVVAMTLRGTGTEAQTVRVDAGDAASLAAFARGCDVVVHCAGPSRRTSPAVVRAALAAGAQAVDAGGGSRADPLTTDVGERTVLYDAGALPGLSGLLPRALAVEHFDTVRRLTTYAGALDRFTATGADDYLDGVLGPSSEPFAAWLGGARRTDALGTLKDLGLPYFPRPLTAHPYLDTEAERLAEDLSLSEGVWYSVVDGEQTAAVLASARALDRDGAVRALCRATALDSAGRTPYLTLLVQADGVRAGRSRTRTAVLRAPGVSSLTGAVAGVAALAVLRGQAPPGVHPAATALAADAALALLTADPAVCRVDVHDAAVADLATVEEGVL